MMTLPTQCVAFEELQSIITDVDILLKSPNSSKLLSISLLEMQSKQLTSITRKTPSIKLEMGIELKKCSKKIHEFVLCQESNPTRLQKIEGIFYRFLEEKCQYPHFFHYLMAKPTIYDMEIFQIADVVLEGYEAIMQKVESAIPEGHSNVLFLIGITGSGMSTTFCFLRGDAMVLDNCHHRYDLKDDKEGLIDHASSVSKTLLPNVALVEDLAIVDFCGFSTTYGELACLASECALLSLTKKYHPKILVIHDIRSYRHGYPARLKNKLSRLFENKEECSLGITRYVAHHQYCIGSEQAFKFVEKKIMDEIGLKGEIVRFDDLSPSKASLARSTLSQKEIRVNPTRTLCPELRRSLDQKFSKHWIGLFSKISLEQKFAKHGISGFPNLASTEDYNTYLSCVKFLNITTVEGFGPEVLRFLNLLELIPYSKLLLGD